MDDIKSAREIALEKVAGIGEATEEEKLRWKYIPEGEKLAARYLKEGIDLTAGLKEYPEKAARYVAEGVSGILGRNINLPVNEVVRKNNKRAMDGLKVLKQDKVAVENVFSAMRRIFEHYQGQGEQQRQQAYQQLKTDFEAKVRQAIQQQMGTATGIRIDVEKQPQFQEEWRQLQARLDAQYQTHLAESKRELAEIS